MKRTLPTAALLAALFLATVPVFGASEFSASGREAYLKGALDAFRKAPPQNINNIREYVALLGRSKCRSASDVLTLNCLEEESAKNCQSGEGRFAKYCPVLSDLAVVNRVNENLFVSEEERDKLSEKSADYSSAYRRTLERKYAMLATEFILLSKKDCAESDDDCLSRQLDQYCVGHADVKGLPWQGCAAAILWFIGTTK